VDRVFVAGEIRQRTKTGAGRDVEIIGPLADDLITHHEQTAPESSDALVCPSRVGTPIHLENWRRRVWRPAVVAVGLEWATPYTGRRTDISLMIHAGVSPVLVAAAVGHTSGETIWKHYARVFDGARTTGAVPMDHAVRAARRAVRRNSLPAVFPRDNVVQLRPATKNV